MLVGLKSGVVARFKSPHERSFPRCFPGPILLTGPHCKRYSCVVSPYWEFLSLILMPFEITASRKDWRHGYYPAKSTEGNRQSGDHRLPLSRNPEQSPGN